MSNTKHEIVQSLSFVLLADQEGISLETVTSLQVMDGMEVISDAVSVKATTTTRQCIFTFPLNRNLRF